MARYRRSYRRSRTPVDRVWIPNTFKTTIAQAQQGKIYQLSFTSPTDTIVDLRDGVIERIRGTVMWKVGVSNALPVGWIFAKVMDVAAMAHSDDGKEVDHLGDPSDPQKSDDYPVIEPACLPTASGAASPQEIIVDSKAKRKFNKDQCLAWGIAIWGNLNTSTTYPVVCVGGFRTLVKIT